MTATERRHCLVMTFDRTATRAEGMFFKKYDEPRARFHRYPNEFRPGFWTICNCKGILQIPQDPEALRLEGDV